MKKHKPPIDKRHRFMIVVAIVVVVACLGAGVVGTTAFAGGNSNNGNAPTLKTGDNDNTPYQCGSGKNAVHTTIDLGCYGTSCHSSSPNGCNALTDAIFAIIRFLTVGVGMIIVASMIWAGIQYTTSRDDPSMVSQAKQRIVNNVIAILIFVFAAAILDYVIPQGFLNL